MKKSGLFLLIIALAVIGLSQLNAQSPEDAKFQKMIDNYLDGMWKFFPTAATLAGYTKYNDKLEDLSAGAIEKRTDALDAFSKELVTKVDRSKLSPENLSILTMMLDALDLEFVKFENILPWEYNPLFYNDIFLNSVRGLLVKESSPLDARVKSATERAKLLPALIKKAKENLKTPAQIYTETAIKQLPAIIDFYKTEVPSLTAAAAAKNSLQTEIGKVITALEDYQVFLKNELLAKSSGNFRLGPDTHLRTLRMLSQGVLPMDEIVAKANADIKNIRREMFLVCIPFYRIMYPNINLEQMTTQRGEEEVRNLVIKGVLDKIKGEPASRDDFVNRIAASVAKIKAFLIQSKLFEIPAGDLKVEVMPPASAGMILTRLVSPGAYEPDGPYTLQIMPVSADWTNEQAAAFMAEHNVFYLDFLTVQKVFPGSFFPAFFTRKDPSIVKRLYANQALLRGWPVYTEDMFINAGYGDYDLRLRLNQLKLMLMTVIDFQLELNIHQGGMTQEQAINYMVRSGFQSDVEAERKWNQILLSPTYSALPYIGYQEILEFEKDYKKLKGDAFNQKEFLQKLVSFGPLPLKELKLKLAQ
jgi:hypothetical protein